MRTLPHAGEASASSNAASDAWSLQKLSPVLEALPSPSPTPTEPPASAPVLPIAPFPAPPVAPALADVPCAMCEARNFSDVPYCQACGTAMNAPPPNMRSVAPLPIAAAEASEEERLPVIDPVPPALAPPEAPAPTIETPMSVVTSLTPVVEMARVSDPVVLPIAWSASRKKRVQIAACAAVVGLLAFALAVRATRPTASTAAVAAAVAAAPAAPTALPSSVTPPQNDPPPAAEAVAEEDRKEAAPPPAKSSEIPPGMGLLKTSDAAPGRRIFINGHVAGQTPRSILFKCGAAHVKIGSSGHTHVVDIPCGEEIRLGKR
jgi:hypothetical protein